MPRSLSVVQALGYVVDGVAQDGGTVTAVPVAVIAGNGNVSVLVVLCAVGDEEDVRLRGGRRAAVADRAGAAGDEAVDRIKRGIDMRAAGAKVCVGICVKQRGKVCGRVVDGALSWWVSR